MFLDRGAWPRRLVTLVPSGGVAVLWFAAYHAAGYGAKGSGLYLDAGAQPLAVLHGALVNPLVVNLSGLTLPVANPSLLFPFPAQHVVAMIGALVLGALALLAAPLLKESAPARFFAAGMLLTVVPFAATLPQDRFALFSGLGSMGLLALFASACARGAIGGSVRRRVATALVVGHLLMGVLAKPAAAMKLDLLEDMTQNMVAALGDVTGIEERTVVLVDLPAEVPMLLVSILAGERGRLPAHLYHLHDGQAPVRVSRPSDRCLELEPSGGWFQAPFERLFWPSTHAFEAGQTTRAQAMQATVVEVSPDGRPMQTRFCFDAELEDPRLVWMTWRDGLVPFSPPGVGESIVVESRLF